MGLGRVKTPTFNLRVEIPSRFRKFENQKCLRPLLREDDRENNSAHSWLVHVFTQSGSIATETCPHYVRSYPDSDHIADAPTCRKSAIAVSTSIPGFRSRPITFSVRPTRCAASRATKPVPHAMSNTRSPGCESENATTSGEHGGNQRALVRLSRISSYLPLTLVTHCLSLPSPRTRSALGGFGT